MVQINIDISIFDNHLLWRTFICASMPQHTHTHTHTHIVVVCTLLPQRLEVMTQVFVYVVLLSWMILALCIVPYTNIKKTSDDFGCSLH
jgi:TRAP-type C4-dicarboxylate transport system permease small subunit